MANEFPDIPGHHIIRRLGAGGMSAVYLAEQLGAARKVALKVLQPDYSQDAEAVQRFENEARTIGQLDHPHIVHIFDVGRTADGQAYFSMPWLPRGDLTRRADRNQPAILTSIMRALLEALAYAHKRGVVHRDVKPENVMFDGDNQPQLADFGIALSNSAELRLTRPGATVGSSGYMSPEQARGLPTDGRSDLYSVGVMLYELLTGDMPFLGPDALSVSIAHVEDPVPTLPPAQRIWQPLIDRAMAKSPDDRYASAEQMLDALNEIAPVALAGGSGSSNWRYSWRNWHTRNRGVMVGVAAVLLAIMVLAMLAFVRERQMRSQQAAAAQSSLPTATATQSTATTTLLTTAQLDQLIREGNIRLSLGALVDPPGNNAGQRFASILHAYPNNPEAIDGMSALYDKLAKKIAKALTGNDGQQALQLYQRGQQMADRASIRQQPFWQAFVASTREAATKNLARASRQSQDRLDTLRPIADALDLAVPKLQKKAPSASDTTARTADATPTRSTDRESAFALLKSQDGGQFAISRHPVTRQQYARFVEVSGRPSAFCRTPGNFFSRLRSLSWLDPGFEQTASQTVYCVSWQDARAFAGWFSQTSGHDYRLPTQSEWLAAAQSKSSGVNFSGTTREWLRCTGACKDAPVIASNGKINRESADNGYSHVGFRLVREMKP